MAYLAFYRMFRPDTFEKVVRQEHIIQILKNQIQTDRVGHAYLFCGPRGTGKTTVARIFARAINCLSPVNGSPCGKCAACRALAQAGNLDVVEIDAASNNGVDEMRELREKVQYPPVSVRYKVYIIDEVHMLTDSAFNALLKTLEEPPKHAVFIMATTEPHKIPATILSRCMRFDFKLLPQEDLEEHLKRVLESVEKPYEQEAVSAIARAGAGSDRDMLSLADMCVSYSSGTLTYDDVTKVLGSADFYETGDLCRQILAGNNGEAISKLESILSEGKSIGVLVKDCLNFLNRCTIAKTCREGERILSLPQKMYEYVAEIGKQTDGHRLLRVTEIFAKAENDMRYSASPRILLETAVVKASMPSTDYDIENLLARIGELEKKLAEGIPVREAPAPVKTEPSAQAERPQKKITEPKQPVPAEEEIFPTEPVFDEEPVFADEPVFSGEPVRKQAASVFGYDVMRKDVGFEDNMMRKAVPSRQSVSRVQAEPKKEEPVSPTAEENEDFKVNTFGKFLRAVRKMKQSPVLYVMCRDLRSDFDGDTFVLKAEGEIIYKSLLREDHTAAIKSALESIGVKNFRVEFVGQQEKNKISLAESVKQNFPDVKIEIK